MQTNCNIPKFQEITRSQPHMIKFYTYAGDIFKWKLIIPAYRVPKVLATSRRKLRFCFGKHGQRMGCCKDGHPVSWVVKSKCDVTLVNSITKFFLVSIFQYSVIDWLLYFLYQLIWQISHSLLPFRWGLFSYVRRRELINPLRAGLSPQCPDYTRQIYQAPPSRKFQNKRYHKIWM